jgi:FixJ family two-component response regulator
MVLWKLEPAMTAATILVVDDQAAVLEMVSQALRGAGYDVLSAGGPEQALAILQDRQPVNLVLSDIEMPGMPGTELLREVSRVAPGTGTVLMTGGTTVAEVPADTPLLRKPISTHDLLATVEDVLARSAEARLELRRQRERSAELRQERLQLRSQFQATAQRAAGYVERSRAYPGERAASNVEAQLRRDLLAAQAEWHRDSREFDQFCLHIQARAQGRKAPDRVPPLEQVAARQQASFEKFQRALLAFTTFRLSSGNPHPVPRVAANVPHITQRELEVLSRLVAGKTTKQIACELNIAFKTVSSHRNNLLQKFDAGNVALLVSKAIRAGYIQP